MKCLIKIFKRLFRFYLYFFDDYLLYFIIVIDVIYILKWSFVYYGNCDVFRESDTVWIVF